MNSITAEIPLRDATEWAGYRDAAPIPLRFGRCGGEALQYDDTRTRFVWNGVPSASVDVVMAGGQRVTNWTWRNAPDSTGKPVTFIEFAEPVAEGLAVVARGRAALHPLHGGLLENPADVLWFVLAYVGGIDLPVARLATFRQQAGGLPVGGSIEQRDQLYTIARSICDSIGAICSPDMHGFARLWPEFDGAASAVVTGDDDVTVDCRTESSTIITDLTLWYAFEAGQPRGAVEYRTVRTPPTGRRTDKLDMPWITSSRVASLVCQRLLRLRARPQYAINVRDFRGELRLGQAVELAHPLIPVTGTHVVRERELDYTHEGPRTSFTVLAPVGAAPALELRRNTNSSEPIQSVDLVAAQLGSEFEVDVRDDETGQPLADAECTLDGVITRRADSAGRVKFPSRYATRGEHELVAVAPGRDPVTILITVR